MSLDTMEDLEGTMVPVEFAYGNIVVSWPRVVDGENAEEVEVEKKDEHEATDEDSMTAGESPDGGGPEEDNPSVQVEETTVAASSDDSTDEATADGGENADG